MAKAAAYLETISLRRTIVVAGVCGVLLLVAIIVGTRGPSTFDSTIVSSYNCTNNSHVWNPSTCNGVQMSMSNASWTMQIQGLSPLNGFWSLAVWPFLSSSATSDKMITLNTFVALVGRNSMSDAWTVIVANDTHQDDTICWKGDIACAPFVLVYEEFIKYQYYSVNISFSQSPSKDLLGDVQWEVLTYDRGFSRLQIGLRLVFLFLGLALFGFYLLHIRSFTLEDLCFEQRWLLILIPSLIFLNNPFYPFEFLVRNWFFSFLGSLLESLFLCCLFLFLLFVIDKYRREDASDATITDAALKFGGVLLFGVLSIVLFFWTRIRERQDPVMYDGAGAEGLLVMDDVVTVCFALLMVWIVALAVIAVGVLHNHATLTARFRFMIVPSGVVVFSMLIAMFFRVYGPFNRNVTSFAYFFTLYNLYVWTLTYGFWPIKAGFSEPSEVSPLAIFDKKRVEEDVEEESVDGL